MLQEKVIRMAFKRFHVVRVAGAKVVDADNKVAFRKKLMSQVEPEESGAASQQRHLARCRGAHGCGREEMANKDVCAR